jgi:exosortase A-associated hydrolase 1
MFVELARHMAASGTSALRFDYRGMGDSDGEVRTFESIHDDIKSAIDAVVSESGAHGVVLVGLCDGASASLMYAPDDARVVGLVLLNPSVHSIASEAKARMSHYYWSNITQPQFWRRLVSGEVRVFSSIASFARTAVMATRSQQSAGPPYVERMLSGMRRFRGGVLFALSSEDLTAQEFSDLVATSEPWRSSVSANNVSIVALEKTDHTFSGENQIKELAGLIATFIGERLSNRVTRSDQR